MKNIWECEVCRKQFYNEQECIDHEAEHRRIESETRDKENRRKESLDNLNKLYEKYFEAIKKHQEEFGNPIIHKFSYPMADFWRNFFD